MSSLGTSNSTRHRWGDPVRFEFKTERECARCGMVKVTRHEPFVRPWPEFFRGLDRIACDGTPACDARNERRQAA